MAQMATTPVFACKHCGKPVVATLVQSYNDPQAEKLKFIMQGLAQIALCPDCQQKKLYLQSQGRGDEFKENPMGIIYAVRDNSELDYYGRKMK
jgi:hypothetical protein